MGKPIDDAALDTLFREKHTHTKWQARPRIRRYTICTSC